MNPLVQIQGNIIDLSKVYKIGQVYGKIGTPYIEFKIGFLNNNDEHIRLTSGYDLCDQYKDALQEIHSLRDQLIEKWNRFKNCNSDQIIPEIKPILNVTENI